VLTDLRLAVTVEEITSSWGPRKARLASARMLALISELLAQIEESNWIQPKISFEVCPIVSTGPGWLELRGATRLISRTLVHHLPGALQLGTGVCTIGDVIENRVREGFAASDRLRAVILDEIGTLALFRLSEKLEEMIREEAGHRGLEASGVLSPGEDGLEISLQEAICDLASSSKIGVFHTSSGMLVPRKSISMVVGLGTRMPKWSRGDRCARCGARERCPHRHPQLVEVTR